MAVRNGLFFANQKKVVSQSTSYKANPFYCLNKIQFQIEKKEASKFTQLKKIVESSNEFESIETQISEKKLCLTINLKSYSSCSNFEQIVYDSHAIMAGFVVVNNLFLNPEEVIIEYESISGENDDFEVTNLILPLRDAMNCIGRNW